MMGFILESQNMPFTIALTIMVMIAVLEGVTTMIGMGVSNMVEAFVPDLDLDTDLDQPDFSSQGVLTRTMGWFRIGQVPFLIILIVFLTLFGLTGLMVQSLVLEFAGTLLPGILASAITLLAILPMVRMLTGIIARVMPKDETEAVAEKSFIGQVAVITLGKAARGCPAQAKLRDRYGTTHYLMVEPDPAGETFIQGEAVLIVKQAGAGYTAIRNPIPVLEKSNQGG